MTTGNDQDIRYWLTPAGCAIGDGHHADVDGRHCKVCGTRLDEVTC